MTTHQESWLYGILLGILFTVAVGVIPAWGLTRIGYQREAIERGFAEYNSKTGAWQWKPATTPEHPQ